MHLLQVDALEIETQTSSVLKYVLKNNRRNVDNMNKSHVNVATSDASVICDGEVLNSRVLDAPKQDVMYMMSLLSLWHDFCLMPHHE